jgi:hypothetical protein
MPTLRLEDEHGRCITGMQLNAPAWKPGDRIPRCGGALAVVEVRAGEDGVTLVVKGHSAKSE